MSIHVALLIAYMGLALLFSFLCSVAEAVLLSITPSYIEGLRETRPRRAALLTRLRQDEVDRSLAAILTLNTIAHTVGAIGAGAKADAVFGSVWFGLFSAVMTLLILFLSEIVPKTIGAVYWTRLTGPVATFVHLLILVLYPIVRISEGLTRWIAAGKQGTGFSREEFLAMARMGEQSGQIQAEESRMIGNLLRFASLKIADIMTPRTVVEALPEAMSIGEALKRVTAAPFSRLPLYRGGIDEISGFVLKDDVLIASTRGSASGDLTSLKREILAVPESVSLPLLFERLLQARQQIAVVVDEHGGTAGLVTLEDLVETLMGMEIVDETDNVADMRLLARRQWIKRARELGIDAATAERIKEHS